MRSETKRMLSVFHQTNPRSAQRSNTPQPTVATSQAEAHFAMDAHFSRSLTAEQIVVKSR